MGVGAMVGGKTNARRRKAWIVFQDESGVSQRPSVRLTWAPHGQTPVLIHAFNWQKISVAAARAYRWDGKRCRRYFQIRPGNYGAESLVAFLKELRRHFRGQRIILVWDGLPAHKSRIMQEYLESQRPWLTEERLPATRRISTRSRPCGAISRGKNWPIAARKTRERRPRQFARGWRALGNPSNSRLPSCTTPVFLFDRSVTLLYEAQIGSTVFGTTQLNCNGMSKN